MTAMKFNELPLPEHYNPATVGEVWRVPYQERAKQAHAWAKKKQMVSAAEDRFKLALLLVDVQNTFCIPGFELFVAGRSGQAAVDDNRRLCEFVYRNINNLTHVTATMDTHKAMQIFHPIFLVNEAGEHPEPVTTITYEDVVEGKWRFNASLADSLGIRAEYGQAQLLHYVEVIKGRGKYNLTIWPYHAMLGGIGHALVAAVEEALFFHTICRSSQVDIQIKGDHPLTEHYSVLRPEVMDGPRGEPIGQRNEKFISMLQTFDAVIIAGQAKSHCVSWTIADLLADIQATDERLAQKVYLLEDCMSPVVIPGVVDYTEQADAVFDEFAKAGMHLVKSVTPIAEWF